MLKEACMSNFSFVGCMEVAVLWLEKQQVEVAIMNVKAGILHDNAAILVFGRIRGFLSPS